MIATVAPIWFTERAAGVTALLFSSLSVTLGLLMAARVLGKGIGSIEARALHEAVALATLAAIAVHGLAVLFDPVLGAGLSGLLVPLASPYRAVGVAAGQLAAYGMLALGLGYYARGRIGPKRWRRMHRVVPAFWVLATAHALLVGSDRGQWWFLAALAPPVATALVLLIRRWLPRQPPAPATAAPAGGAPVPTAATSSTSRTATPRRAPAGHAPRSRPAGSPRPVR